MIAIRQDGHWPSVHQYGYQMGPCQERPVLVRSRRAGSGMGYFYMAGWSGFSSKGPRDCTNTGSDGCLTPPPPPPFKFAGSRFKEINRAISRYVTETKDFPDFGSIKGLVEQANSKYNLNLRPISIYETAKEIFRVWEQRLKTPRYVVTSLGFAVELLSDGVNRWNFL